MIFILALASSVSALLLPTNVPLRVRGVLNPLPSLKMALSAASVPAMHDCSNVSPEISPLGMAIDSKADLVSIEQGTDSTEHFSNGNTLPLVARPFGHAHFAPETAGTDADRWYHPSATDFVGYRLTHQPSPWMGDYGWLPRPVCRTALFPVSEPVPLY